MTPECPSKNILERFFYSGTPAYLKEHTQTCATCRVGLSDLSRENKMFLNQYPFEALWKKIESRKTERSFWSRLIGKLLTPQAGPLRGGNGPLRTAAAMATLAGLALLAVWNHQQPTLSSKGGFGINLYVAHDGQLEKAKDGMKLAPNSDLQFVYSSKKEGFFLIFGVEANGNTTVYFPQGGTTSAPLEPGEKQPLPTAIRWQPTSDYERFYTLYSDEPLRVEDVKQLITSSLKKAKTVEHLDSLPLFSSQFSILVYRASR